jgi:glycosyltransferase involved in cell wall biosynthesis
MDEYHIIKITLLIAFFIILINALLYFKYISSINKKKKRVQELYEDKVPSAEFPFKNIFDDQDRKVNIIAITAPFRSKDHEDKYNEYKKKGISFIGISSYLDYPNRIDNPFEDQYHVEKAHNYPSMVDTWIHCFRKKGYTEPFKHLPHLLLTEADLKLTKNIPEPKPMKDRKYDFIYCCLKDNDKCEPGWQSYNRNWDLAKKCLEVFCRVFRFKGIIVGRENCEFTDDCDGIVKVVPFLPYHEFQDLLRDSKFLFTPNISDASPRVITEAMCNGLPVVVNQNILGGWHNVIPDVTGEFFNDETDVEAAVRKVSENLEKYTPRKWYFENRGREKSGAQFAEFLKKYYPEVDHLSDTKYVYML